MPTVRSVDAELSKRHGARTIADFAGVTFEDRGEHSLKGVSEPHRLFAVVAHQRSQLAVELGSGELSSSPCLTPPPELKDAYRVFEPAQDHLTTVRE